jgi:hypothetical protein
MVPALYVMMAVIVSQRKIVLVCLEIAIKVISPQLLKRLTVPIQKNKKQINKVV